MNPLMKAEEVAKIMGLDIPTVREWTKDSNCPFGHAIKLKNSWRYIIIRARFDAYMSAQDMKQA
jgi:hypothetical protein